MEQFRIIPEQHGLYGVASLNRELEEGTKQVDDWDIKMGNDGKWVLVVLLSDKEED